MLPLSQRVSRRPFFHLPPRSSSRLVSFQGHSESALATPARQGKAARTYSAWPLRSSAPALLPAAERPHLSTPAGTTSAPAAAFPVALPLPLPRKILIANRGEIACRIIRTCQSLGIATVAVYSDADANSLFVRMADQALRLGPAPAIDSYLRMDSVIQAALQTGAEMVHPGYGFLSENPNFAQRVSDAGLIFIGPPPEAIRAMGSKSASKQMMEAAGVPCVPGYHGADQDPELLLSHARNIGWPVLVKPTAGGGGKGMKVVHHESDFPAQLASAQREARAGFGDPRVLLERWIPRPRHVEVQIISDAWDRTVHLGTRDCSTQRNHQKVLEEAPAPGLDPDLLDRLGQTAVQAARAAGYNAAVGTVEFLLDATNPHDFFFCEMNTRLQVEHPVTEAITGLDLVSLQIQIAAGHPLPVTQEQVKACLAGHAFEARLYAEHPRGNYLPSSGQLIKLELPGSTHHGPTGCTLGRVGPPLPPHLRPNAGVRIDTGVQEGDEVSVHYDPMIAKLIVTGHDRPDALRRLYHALQECIIVGPHTNLSLLRRLAVHPALARAEVDTALLSKYSADLLPPLEGQPVPLHAVVVAATWCWFQSISAQYGETSNGSSSFNTRHKETQTWDTPELKGFRITPQSVRQERTFFDPLRAAEARTVIRPLPSRAELLEVVIDREGQETVRVCVEAERDAQHSACVLLRPGVALEASLGSRSEAAPRTDASNDTISAHGSGTAPDHETGLSHTITGSVVPYPQTLRELRQEGQKMVVVLPREEDHEAHVELYVRPPDWVEWAEQASSNPRTAGGFAAASRAGSKTADQDTISSPMPCRMVQAHVKPGDEVRAGDPLVILEAMKTEHVLHSPRDGVVRSVAPLSAGQVVGQGERLVVLEPESER